MTQRNDAHEVYARLMLSSFPFGYPFYEPESAQDVKRGACGYLNDSGHWRPIVDLTQSAVAIRDKGYTAIGTCVPLKPSIKKWGPLLTAGRMDKDLEGNIEGSAGSAGIPLDVNAMYSIKSTSDSGAILLCPNDIVLEEFSSKVPFREWVEKNAAQVLRKNSEVEKYGFYVVTTTYSTINASINVWTRPQQEYKVGFKASVAGAAGIGSSARYYVSHSASGWIHAPGTEEAKVVVFFGGIYYKYKKRFLGKHTFEEIEQTEWAHRGSSKKKFFIKDEENDHSAYEVEWTTIGDEV